MSGTPADFRVPVAVTPTITEDPNSRGLAAVIIDPATPDTEYALVDKNGEEVYPFTAPDGSNRVVFGGLDPDTEYQIVPRKAGSNDTAADRRNAGAALTVNTQNLGLQTNNFDVSVIANNTNYPSGFVFKINGTTTTDSSKLLGIRKNTPVEIVATPVDNSSNLFVKWKVLYPKPGTVNDTTDQRIVFTMPGAPVKLQAIYGDTLWEESYQDNISSGKYIGVEFPAEVTENGNFRVLVTKDSMPSNVKDEIATQYTNPYTGVFTMHLVVQKENPAGSGNWVDYTLPSGAELSLKTTVETGALVSDREYKFHELATASNAAIPMSGEFENAQSNGSTYPGAFDIVLKNGGTYAFGYTVVPSYKVKIRDSRDNSLITTLTITEGKVVNDFASVYGSRIRNGYVDQNGITWTYKGLSRDRNSYDAYDPTLRVTQDETLYLFYEGDHSDRSNMESTLNRAIGEGGALLGQVTDPAKKAQLEAAIAAAKAIINQTSPRKASTAELKAALDALNAAIVAAGGKAIEPDKDRRGGGGRSGGGGGGGSSRTSTTTTRSGNIYTVGVDGNWQQLNPGEPDLDKSIWVFNRTNGTRVTGWAQLSYTYQGQTRVGWYFFKEDGVMVTGWYLDAVKNTWYFLSKEHNGFYGEMKTGWHLDTSDGKWYYLEQGTGSIRTGWNQINSKDYYFNPQAAGQTWFFDAASMTWNYNNPRGLRPLGSMFANERTPDGYYVGADGAWQR